MRLLRTLALLFAVALLGACASHPGKPDRDHAVYHFNLGNDQSSDGLRNVRNHLSVDKKAKIVVVTHARGVDFLMKDAKDRNGYPYQLIVEQLKEQGVEFRICEITLQGRNLRKDQFIEEASFVPSGVAELTRLQLHEGYAYIKP
jgi:intracellular sulfur oxidation DsrE/DsrF family protein